MYYIIYNSKSVGTVVEKCKDKESVQWHLERLQKNAANYKDFSCWNNNDNVMVIKGRPKVGFRTVVLKTLEKHNESAMFDYYDKIPYEPRPERLG